MVTLSKVCIESLSLSYRFIVFSDSFVLVIEIDPVSVCALLFIYTMNLFILDDNDDDVDVS